ncbi:hypothetical protein F2Q68_00018374 [Brassica cretica]|uniref:Uncharacterized protein n=1 Tax=Brassica cretica TaxID=69181 RepID=A0A8S9HGG1_BRACR|nr:hypothetical protein F2Q68_00018374 [Brassica cretica]
MPTPARNNHASSVQIQQPRTRSPLPPSPIAFKGRVALAWLQACVSAYYVAYSEDPHSMRFDGTIPQRIQRLQMLRAHRDNRERERQESDESP